MISVITTTGYNDEILSSPDRRYKRFLLYHKFLLGYGYLKKCNGDQKIVKATKMIVISSDTVVVCIGPKRNCQCHRYL